MAKNTGAKIMAHYRETDSQEKIQNQLIFLLKKKGFPIRPLVMLCIGSDRYTGDALGPLIGSHLLEHTDSIVYGTLDFPVHAGNLVETVQMIQCRHEESLIIAVDACLGKANEIGNIEVWEGGIEAGIAVGHRLPSVGDISIIGVVNSGGKIGYLDLQNTPLSTVMKLSRVISSALEGALQHYS